MAGQLKLVIELVPKTSWGKNIRAQITRRAWERERAEVIESQGNRCGLCGADGKLRCHEIWDYDDSTLIQKLSGLIALCGICDLIKHLGRTSHLIGAGIVNPREMEEHFMRVNECDLETFKKHRDEAMAQWKRRSNHTWTIDLGEYQSLVTNRKKASR